MLRVLGFTCLTWTSSACENSILLRVPLFDCCCWQINIVGTIFAGATCWQVVWIIQMQETSSALFCQQWPLDRRPCQLLFFGANSTKMMLGATIYLMRGAWYYFLPEPQPYVLRHPLHHYHPCPFLIASASSFNNSANLLRCAFSCLFSNTRNLLLSWRFAASYRDTALSFFLSFIFCTRSIFLLFKRDKYHWYTPIQTKVKIKQAPIKYGTVTV